MSTEKKVALFLADGCEEIEALTVVDLLFRAGIPCDTVSINETAAVTSSHNVKITADCVIGDLDFDAYDMLVLPGGMPGAANIAASRSAVALLEACCRAGKLVCAICAAPALVLSKTSALEGKSWTCYPGMEGNAAAFAAGHREGVPFVHDGNVITGRGPGAAEEFSMEIVKTLCGQEAFDTIRKGALLR